MLMTPLVQTRGFSVKEPAQANQHLAAKYVRRTHEAPAFEPFLCDMGCPWFFNC